MKKTLSIFFTLLAALLGSSPITSAQEAGQMNGYRNCSTHNLAACDNSNELFFGPFNKSGPSPRKPDFPGALDQFLHGAPKLFIVGHGATPAQIAQESLVGPGDHHDHLPSGEWFFDGFTPHDAPDKGAVMFDRMGKLIAVALLNTETDGPTTQANFGQYQLRLYSNGAEPRDDIVKLFQEWARSVIDPKSIYPGVFPNNRLLVTKQFVSDKTRWITRPVP